MDLAKDRVILQCISGIVSDAKVDRLVIPINTNYMVEQACVGSIKSILTNSTITYNKLLGYGYIGEDSLLKPVAEIEEMFSFIFKDGRPNRIFTPEELAIMASMLYNHTANVDKAINIAYYKKLVEDFKDKIGIYYDKAAIKYRKIKSQLVSNTNFSFSSLPYRQIFSQLREKDIVYYDPIYSITSVRNKAKGFDELFTGSKGVYEEVSAADIEADLTTLNAKGNKVIYRIQNTALERLNLVLPEAYRKVSINRYKYNSEYYLYTNFDVKSRVYNTISVKEEVVNYPLISETDVIHRKSKVSIILVKDAVANHYRLLWIKKAQVTDGAGVSYLVFIDGKVIGALSLVEGRHFSLNIGMLMSDPVCPHSKYIKLSKLLIMLAATEPFLKLFSEDTLWAMQGLVTKVFTNNPSSMKYRGVYVKDKMEEVNKGGYKYAISYRTDKLFKTYKEALNNWLDKHAQTH